jgi:membrane protein DedA with SNARE-associated domain
MNDQGVVGMNMMRPQPIAVTRRSRAVPTFAVVRFCLVAAGLATSLVVLFAAVNGQTVFARNLRPHSFAIIFLIISTTLIFSTPKIGQFCAPSKRFRWYLTGTIVFLTSAVVASHAFSFGSYLSDDEFVYLFQAKTLAAGRLWNQSPPLADALTANFVGFSGGKWFGMYPPGWPGALAVAQVLALPLWQVIAAVFVSSLICLTGLLLPRVGRSYTLVGLALFGLAPFTCFNAATIYSHGFSALLVLLAAYGADRARKRDSFYWAIVAGCAIGLIGITRTISAVAVLPPVLIAFALSPRRVKLGAGLAVGGAPFLAVLLSYQYALTGSPFKSPYWLAGRTVDHLYFDLGSILHGIVMTPTRLMELSLWTTPVVTILWILAMGAKFRTQRLECIDWIFPAAFLVYLFYPKMPHVQYGPRYFYDFWALGAFTIVTGLLRCLPRHRAYARSLLLISCVYGAYAWPLLAQVYRQASTSNLALDREIAARGLNQAIVCIRGISEPQGGLSSGDLARNDVAASASVLKARCDLTSPAQLAAVFPNRSVWIYDHDRTGVDHLYPYQPSRQLAVGQPASASVLVARPSAEEPPRPGVVERIGAWIISVISAAGYSGIALLMAIESACIPLPSELIMPFAGYLTAIGRLNLFWVATAGAIGCNLGSIPAYWIGRTGGRAVVLRWGSWLLAGPKELDRAEDLFERLGDWAVLLGRLLPLVRSFIAFPAGIARMNQLRFHIFTFIGSWPWCFGLAYIGHRLGQRWNDDPKLKATMHGLDGLVLVIIAGLVIFYVVTRVRHARGEGRQFRVAWPLSMPHRLVRWSW